MDTGINVWHVDVKPAFPNQDCLQSPARLNLLAPYMVETACRPLTNHSQHPSSNRPRVRTESNLGTPQTM
eukprot:6073875-Alexandrium_andersonii.AAC.1